jgi:hypothetical protein
MSLFEACGADVDPVTNVLMAWNTHQMEGTLNLWRAQGRQIDAQILHHITPMGFERINFRGRGSHSWMPPPKSGVSL